MLDWLAAILGLVSVAVVLVAPLLFSVDELGDTVTRLTVRLALIYYAAALTSMLLLLPAQWRAHGARGRLARWLWTWAWLIYLVHVACAFHFFHHWSHADAVRHTAEVSGFGPGIYASYFFTLVWGIDVATWWLAPEWYASRSRWIDWLMHLFMLFMVFNATVIFETGLIRWAGVAFLAELACVYLYRVRLARTWK